MHECLASKDSQVWIWRITPLPCSIRKVKTKRNWWRTVNQIQDTLNCFSLECLRKIRHSKHTSHFLHNGSIHPFCNSIVLWCTGLYLLMSYVMLWAIILELFRSILTTIISSKVLHLSFCLPFYHGMKFLKNLGHLAFCLQHIHPSSSSSIIDESDKIFIGTNGFNFNGTTNIGVY